MINISNNLSSTRRIFRRQKLLASASVKAALSRTFFLVPAPPKTTTLQSVGVSAIILVCLINACSFIGKQLYGERHYKSTENQVNTFNRAERKPEVVLLGSSLFRTPLFVCNLQHGHSSLYEDYCWDDTLQDLLTPNQKHSVLNFAIDGLMVSDAFLVQRKFLTSGNSPKWIVYGIAPRDFLDNFVSKETRTPIFDRLFGVNDILFSNTLFKISPPEKLDLVLGKLCWLYGVRGNVQQYLTKTVQKVIQGEAFQRQNKNFTDPSLIKKESSSKNLRSYRKRYRLFSKDKFEKQALFLQELCRNSIRNGTKVLLVNMPLTNKITNLIPQDAYSAYDKSLSEAARLPGVTMLDLHKTKQFSSYLFGDLVHLNGEGGYLLDLLIAQKLLQEDKPKTKFAANLKARVVQRIEDFSKNNVTGAIDALSSWWLAKSYFAEAESPEIVILGDSQLWPVLGADAYVYRHPVDIVTQHHSLVLEHDIHVLTKKRYRVFIGSIPKAILSDHLAVCQALFSNEFKPKIVALTISPFNFIESNPSSETVTEASTFFSKYSNPISLRKDLGRIRTHKYEPPRSYDYDSQFKAAFGFGEPFERLAPGENMICGLENYPYEDHAAQYKERYSNPLTHRFYEQMNSLESLIKFLNSKHIKVVVFSNPLFGSNKAFLPQSFWEYYNTRMRQICSNNGADYVDAEKTILPFNKDELFDDLHLNLSGGLRWTRCLGVYISNKLQPGSLQKLFELSKYLK